MPHHVLLVDDDQDLVAVHKLHLEAKGYRVSVAYSGQEGWDKLQKDPPELVVLDCMMEEFTSGFELAHDIGLKYPTLPMIMVTSVHDHMNKDWSFGPADKNWLPIHRWMEKPVAPAKLLATIEELLAGGAAPATAAKR